MLNLWNSPMFFDKTVLSSAFFCLFKPCTITGLFALLSIIFFLRKFNEYLGKSQ